MDFVIWRNDTFTSNMKYIPILEVLSVVVAIAFFFVRFVFYLSRLFWFALTVTDYILQGVRKHFFLIPKTWLVNRIWSIVYSIYRYSGQRPTTNNRNIKFQNFNKMKSIAWNGLNDNQPLKLCALEWNKFAIK